MSNWFRVLDNVAQGAVQEYNKQQQEKRAQAEFEDQEDIRQRQKAARQDMASAPQVGGIKGTGSTVPTMALGDYQSTYAPGSQAPLPAITSTDDATKWARGIQGGQPPSAPTPGADGGLPIGAPPPPPPAQSAPVTGSALGSQGPAASSAPTPAPAAAPSAPAAAPSTPAAAPSAPGAGLGATSLPTALPADAPAAVAPQSLSAGQFWTDFVVPHEGGYNPKDANGYPVNMGINQKANPDIDVRTATPDQLYARYKTGYWDESGAGSMADPRLAAVHADTYFLNKERARDFLQQSGGDPEKYMSLRENFQDKLESQPQFERYRQAWDTRNSDLRSYMGQFGPPSASASAPAQAPQTTADAAPAASAPAPDVAGRNAPSYWPKSMPLPSADAWVPYKLGNGEIRMTAAPTYYDQNDVDDYTQRTLIKHGLYDDAAKLANTTAERKYKQSLAEGSDIENKQKRLLNGIDSAQSPEELEGHFNALENGHFGNARTNSDGTIDVNVFNAATGKPVEQHHYSSFADMRSQLRTQMLTPDQYANYMVASRNAATNEENAYTQRIGTLSENNLRGAQANKLIPAQADNLTAESARTRAATPGVAAQSQAEVDRAGAGSEALGIIRSPTATVADGQRAQRLGAFATGQNAPFDGATTINGQSVPYVDTPAGRMIYSQRLNSYIPMGEGHNLPAMEKSPDFQSRAITLEPVAEMGKDGKPTGNSTYKYIHHAPGLEGVQDDNMVDAQKRLADHRRATAKPWWNFGGAAKMSDRGYAPLGSQ